ncbi:hypothetical protein D3C86_1490080 [compost metagenome]
MRGGKRLHLLGVGLARLLIGYRRDHLRVEGLHVVERKHRDVDHRGPPFFSAGRLQLHRQAAHQIRGVRDERHAACEGKACSDRHTPGRQHIGLAERHARAVAVEPPGRAQSLGVVAPKAHVLAVDGLEAVDHLALGQPPRREPAANIGEATRHADDGGANGAQPDRNGIAAEFAGVFVHVRSLLNRILGYRRPILVDFHGARVWNRQRFVRFAHRHARPARPARPAR